MNLPDLASTIGKLKELEAKATKGPWKTIATPDETNFWGSVDVPSADSVCYDISDGNDALFIANTRNAAPLLLAAAEAYLVAREAIDKLRDNLPAHPFDHEDVEREETLRNAADRIDALLLPFTKG